MSQTDFSFDRAIYTDATSAGLAVLIPIPGLDWLVEEFFRRRMRPSNAFNNSWKRNRNKPHPISNLQSLNL